MEHSERIRELSNELLICGEMFAHLIDDAPEGTDVSYYWNCMEKCREFADNLTPPIQDWGGPNVVPIAQYRKM
jgi:hypothetical protein